MPGVTSFSAQNLTPVHQWHPEIQQHQRNMINSPHFVESVQAVLCCMKGRCCMKLRMLLAAIITAGLLSGVPCVHADEHHGIGDYELKMV